MRRHKVIIARLCPRSDVGRGLCRQLLQTQNRVDVRLLLRGGIVSPVAADAQIFERAGAASLAPCVARHILGADVEGVLGELVQLGSSRVRGAGGSSG